MSKQASRLGKGLSAIVGRKSPARERTAPAESKSEVHVEPSADGVQLKSLDIDQLVPNKRQPRTHFDEQALSELSNSIANQGVLQPVVVRPGRDGKYELIAGERRWRAARQAGLERVPAVVREVSDEEAVELALIENLQREDLNPLERAQAYENYIELYGRTPEELAVRLGESRANVANYLRLLRLVPEVREMLEKGELGMGHARALAGISDAQRQLAIAKLTVRRNLSVRQVEALSRETGESEGRSRAARASLSKHHEDVQRLLSKALGLPVQLQPGRKKNSGQLVIRYKSLEEFDRIAERLSGDNALE